MSVQITGCSALDEETNESLATMTGCPPEVLRAILESVDGQSAEMLRLAVVSRRWYPIASEAAYWRCSVRGRRNLLALFCRNSSRQIPLLKNELSIHGMGDCMLDAIRVEDKHFIYPLCTNLRTLKLALLPDWRWLPSVHFAPLPNIKHFELEVLKKQPSTYTNSTRLVAFFLCVVPEAKHLVLRGVQWLNHIADDYSLPKFRLKSLEMKACVGERNDLFCRLLDGGTCETLKCDESAMPCLLTNYAPNIVTFIYEDDPRHFGRWTPFKTLELLILQWKRLKTLSLPTSCHDMVLHSDSIVRLELRGPPYASGGYTSLRGTQAMTNNLTSLRDLRLPPTQSTDRSLARLLEPMSLDLRPPSPTMRPRRDMSAEMIRFSRVMGLRGVSVHYVFAK